MKRKESESSRKWFTVGVAISLSVGTFASSIGTSMDQPWRLDSSGRSIPIRYGYGLDAGVLNTQDSKISKTPWTGAWWWTQSGSIAVRWRTALYWNAEHTAKYWPTWEETDAVNYEPFSADQLASMTEEEIRDSTSPVEKLDIISGRADPSRKDYYENLNSVRTWVKNVVDLYPEQLSYHGLCHGFSHAAIWLPEPSPVVISVNYILSDGRSVTIPVNFGSGDLKALATYSYGQKIFQRDYDLGQANKNGTVWDSEKDVYGGFVGGNRVGMNPAQLHLLLTNLIRDGDQSFVVDVHKGEGVWNYPVTGYHFNANRSARVYRGADPRATKSVYVSTDVHFMGTTNPTQNAWGSKADDQVFTHHYEYWLELTSDDEIVGGAWASGSEQPDFAWTLKRKIPFEGDFKILEKYWNESA